MAREYSPEVKAAVMASLMEGQSIRGASKEHGVPKSTVQAWSKEAQGLVDGVQDVPTAKREQIATLLIDLLVAKIEAQTALSRHIMDRTWLMKQEASALAMLLGVSDDKLVRLLEKFEGSSADAGTTEG